LVVLLLTLAGAVSAPAPGRPDQAAFRELFEELICYTRFTTVAAHNKGRREV